MGGVAAAAAAAAGCWLLPLLLLAAPAVVRGQGEPGRELSGKGGRMKDTRPKGQGRELES